MLTIIDNITTAFLAAITTGSTTLAAYGVPILSVVALISYSREFGALLLSGGGHQAEALGTLLLFAVSVGGYLWILGNLPAMGEALLATAFQFGTQASGATIAADLLRKPSFIFELGMQAAEPLANFSTWLDKVKSVVKLASNPLDALSYWLVVLAFLGITIHYVMMLIEYYVSLMFVSVLLPWGIWKMSSSLAEFSIGWTIGAAIRATVSVAMVGIATPLFRLLTVPSDSVITLPQTFALLGGSLVFCTISWAIPARAARMAGQATLALSGSTLMASATTLSRFAIMGSVVTRGTSRLVTALR